jgi:arylsulfatase A-like enzyme
MPMARSHRAGPLAVAVVAFVTAACAPDGPSSHSPFAGYNVVLVSIDTLRADRLGTYGHDAPTSPWLDRLARSAVVFEDVISAAPTTAPSHRSIFSGRPVYEHRNDVEAGPLMAELFREAGWTTAAFVDGGQLAEGFGFHRGFEHYAGSGARHVDGAFLGGGLAALGPQVSAWLREPRRRPFFLFLHTYDVHCPYAPPEPYRDRFAGPNPGLDIEDKCGQKYFNALRLDASGFRYVSSLYDGGVRHADRMLGRILDDLQRLGIVDRTIVVVTSDHGESLGERRRIGHNQVHDIQLRIPLMIFLPGTGPRLVEGPAHAIDLLPTLLSLVGIEEPGGLPGLDLSEAAMEGERIPASRFRLAETGNARVKSVRRDDRWTLHLSEGRPTGLYDLYTDPAESRNVMLAQPAVAETLRAAFEARGVPIEDIPEMPRDLEERTREQLEALGYVGD